MQADPPIDPAVQKGLNSKGLRAQGDVADRTVGIEEGKARVGHDSRNQHTGSYTTHAPTLMGTGSYNSGDNTERQCAHQTVMGMYLPGDRNFDVRSESMVKDAAEMRNTLSPRGNFRLLFFGTRSCAVPSHTH